MRILIFNWRDITHPWAGGAERHLHELAKRWVKKGHEVTFVVGGYSSALKRQNIDGIEIIRIGNTYTSFFISPLYYLFKLRKEKYDCIIDTAHGIPFFLPLVSRRPVILVVHHDHKKLWETEFNGPFSKFGIFVEKRLVPLIYKNCRVVTLAASEMEYLLERGYKKVIAIPPGIDTKYLRKTNKKTKVPTILYLGRLRKYKRVDLLIDIFPQIARGVDGVKLIIAGDGQDRANIEYLIRKRKLEKNIILKGFVSEEEKKDLLSSSWVLAFPSLMEGWGLVAMEAAACGTPTVGFNVPGVRDAIKDGISGFLAKNKRDFVDKIVRILLEKRLRNYLSRNSVSLAKNLTWEVSSKDFLDEIERSTQKYGHDYFSSFLRGEYKRKFHPVYDFRIWYISEFLKPKKLLDVGCGTGLVVNSLIDKNIDAYGMDISKYALDNISEGRKERFFIGDIRKIPRPARSFDTVTCIDVLEHIRKEDLPKAIKECARIAKRVVYFDITVLEDILFIFADPSHISKFFSWQWGRIIKDSLGKEWVVRRGPILPMIHHGIFIAEKLK